MTTTSEQDRLRLEQLGDALRAATAEDLADGRGAQSDAHAPAGRTRRRRRGLAVAAVAAAIAVPGVAIAANALIGEDEVARSIPNGTMALIGTDPTCTVVREGVEFDCTLARAPSREGAPDDWLGTVEPSVDDASRVNGGCRSLNGAGTHWRCYVGREAVRQQIVGPDFLGQLSSGPGAG